MSTSVYRGLNPFNVIRKHFLQICLCLSAQQLSERTVLITIGYVLLSCVRESINKKQTIM